MGGGGGGGGFGGAGGGGAGLGGAVDDDGGDFTAAGVTFSNNRATGGNGGGFVAYQGNGGGGGGFVSAGTRDGMPGAGGGGLGGLASLTGGAGGFGGGGGGGGGSSNMTPQAPRGAGGAGGFGGGGGGGGGQSYAAGGAPGSGGFLGGRGAQGLHSGGVGGGGAGLGGAVFSNGGAITLANDTFTGNVAQGGTGAMRERHQRRGLRLERHTRRHVRHLQRQCALDGSSTALDGTDLYVLTDPSNINVTGIRGTSASVALTDDILGQTSNDQSDFVANHVGGSTPTMTGTNDLIRNNSPGSGSGFTGSDVIGGDPKLGTLAANGGPTDTMALLAGSPATGVGVVAEFPGTGTTITVDQRYYSRPGDQDLGAYSFNGVAPLAPVVTLISPGFGTSAGGTAVTIIGTSFTDASAVDFGAITATSFTIDSATEITATSPAGTAGIVDVTVVGPGGTSLLSSADQFAYLGATMSYTVTSTADVDSDTDGVTLRYAIDQAVASNQFATIGFSSSLAGQTITLLNDDTSAANIYGATAFVVNGAEITIDGSGAHRPGHQRKRRISSVRGDDDGFARSREPDGFRWAGPGWRRGNFWIGRRRWWRRRTGRCGLRRRRHIRRGGRDVHE